VHAADYHAYRYRRTWKALRRECVEVGRDRVKRLMRAHGIQGAKRRGRPWRTTKPAAVRRPDLVQRTFTADGPDAWWVADFTSLRCCEGWSSSSSTSTPPGRRLAAREPHAHRSVLDAADGAVATPAGRRRAARAPSAAGTSTPANAFTQVLDDHGVLASIGSVGAAFDNALAENFADSVKTELIADRGWRPHTQLELAIVEYLGWFNHVRLHQALDDRPPPSSSTTL
jgi:putative transposase